MSNTEVYPYNPPSKSFVVPEMGDGISISGQWMHIQVGDIAIQCDIDEVKDLIRMNDEGNFDVLDTEDAITVSEVILPE